MVVAAPGLAELFPDRAWFGAVPLGVAAGLGPVEVWAERDAGPASRPRARHRPATHRTTAGPAAPRALASPTAGGSGAATDDCVVQQDLSAPSAERADPPRATPGEKPSPAGRGVESEGEIERRSGMRTPEDKPVSSIIAGVRQFVGEGDAGCDEGLSEPAVVRSQSGVRAAA